MSWEITNSLKLCVKVFLPLYKKELKGIESKSTPWSPRNKNSSRKLPLIWTKFYYIYFSNFVQAIAEKNVCIEF